MTDEPFEASIGSAELARFQDVQNRLGTTAAIKELIERRAGDPLVSVSYGAAPAAYVDGSNAKRREMLKGPR